MPIQRSSLKWVLAQSCELQKDLQPMPLIMHLPAGIWERTLMPSIKCKWREAARPCKADVWSCEPAANLGLKSSGWGSEGWIERDVWGPLRMCAAPDVESGGWRGVENEEDTWSGFGASLRRPEGRPYLHLYNTPTLCNWVCTRVCTKVCTKVCTTVCTREFAPECAPESVHQSVQQRVQQSAHQSVHQSVQ